MLANIRLVFHSSLQAMQFLAIDKAEYLYECESCLRPFVDHADKVAVQAGRVIKKQQFIVHSIHFSLKKIMNKTF